MLSLMRPARRRWVVQGLIAIAVLTLVGLRSSSTQGSRDHLKDRLPTGARDTIDHILSAYGLACPPTHEEAGFAPAQCSRQAGMDELVERWGDTALAMAEMYLGSGQRVRSFAQKLLDGDPVSLAILGGSVTVGHSLTDEEKTWGQLLYEWIDETYPNAGHRWQNGAVPATGSDYFAACYSQHVPTDADLYVLEFAVNDAYVDVLKSPGVTADAADYTETMVREMLSTSPETAVIMMSVWTAPHDYMSGAEKHAIVSEYYDIPRLSSRAWLYKYFMQHQDELATHYNQEDFGHQNQKGHRYIADILIWYLSQQICALERERAHPTRHQGKEVPSAYQAGYIPPVTIRQRLRDTPVPMAEAFCLTSNARKEDGSWGLLPSKNRGWTQLERNDKSWWTADDPGAQITFDGIEVHGGNIGIYYYRANQALGNFYCWVDGDEGNGQKLVGPWWYAAVGSYGHIRSGVAPGKHSVTCKVLEETDDPTGSHHVRLIAVMAS